MVNGLANVISTIVDLCKVTVARSVYRYFNFYYCR